jgi:serine/threonine protein kinase
MTASRPDPGLGTDLGPYHIESVIGRGGMGVVYLAEQARLGRKVALKIVSPEFSDDPKARARFLRESQMAAAIDHPNILPIYEADEADGVLFIAMRLVEGTDLATRLRAGRLEPRAAAGILGQVANALDAAHARGLVHRDVKPANILLAPGAGADQGDHAYLTDFGLTKRGGTDSSLTAAGGFAGTLAYIAPEQVDGREVDGRADQYSLACMTFECLTGRVPFDRETDIATAMAHIKDPPPSAVALRPDLPPGLDAVLARGMAKSPDDRYQSCSAFMADLRDALGVTGDRAALVTGTTRPAGVMKGPGRTRLLPWLIAGTLGAIVLIAIVAATTGLLGGAAATPTDEPSDVAASASASTGADASPTEDVFPNAAESALLGSLPVSLARDCERGPYAIVRVDAFSQAGKVPSASLSCRPAATSGANVVLVRAFQYGAGGGNTAGDFNVDRAVSGIAQTVQAPAGDCAISKRANGRWQLNGQDAGAIVCFTDTSTGDAILVWSYPDARLLVRATNQRGDSAALYDYFAENARFIAR